MPRSSTLGTHAPDVAEEHDPRAGLPCRVCRGRVRPGRSGLYPATCSRKCKEIDKAHRKHERETKGG